MSVRATGNTKALEAALRRVGGARVSVGIHAGEGAATGEDGLTVLLYATFNEFGLGVPERSFIRAWFDERKEAIVAALRSVLRAAFMAGATDAAFDAALERFALWCEADMKFRIQSGIAPDNAQSTIDRKGSSKPLIDQGLLIASIKAKVNAAGLGAV